jgi:hypothetical protein
MNILFHICSFVLLTNYLSAQTTIKRQKVADTGQIEKPKEGANEGEWNVYQIKLLFRHQYKSVKYDRYSGSIVVNGTDFIFNKQVLTVADPDLKKIIKNGIIYPLLFFIANPDSDTLLRIRIPKTDTNQSNRSVDNRSKHARSQINLDSLAIGDFQELKYVESSPKQKRYLFWLFIKGFANPTEYYIELTNKNATGSTNISDFINGAELTFIWRGSLII